MSPARATAEGVIVLPKKITLSAGIAALVLIFGQVFYLGYNHALAVGRLERVERDVAATTPAIAEMRERLVRIETQVGFIRDAVEKPRR